MQLHKGILACVCVTAFALHAAGLYLWHEMPLASGRLPGRSYASYIFHLEERRERNRALSEIFQQLAEVPQEVKQELCDLSPEQFPAPSLILTSDEPTCLFPSNPLSLPLEKEGDLVNFLAEAPGEGPPYFSSPPLATLRFQEDYAAVGALANSEHFLMSVEVAARNFKPGYIFRISLQPKQDISFKRIRQNYYFLIDRSNSIPRARFALNKRAVSAALDHLQPEDTFNILIFDDKVSRLAESSLSWSTENIAIARTFLEVTGHGGHFAATELYASLGKIIPQNVSNEEVNTAILLSDGDTYLTLEKQRQTIGGWTGWNAGKVSLFCVASGTGNNLSLLDLISSFNKGALVYVPQHDQITEKVVQLMLSLQSPIGKDLVATAVSSDKQTVLHLQPRNIRLPHLYQSRPFTIWGATNRLSDFTLFLQGKYYDKVFDLKKTISLKEAHTGTLALERQWAQLAAQEFYEQFFRDGRVSHLEAAHQFLAPLELPVPFIKQP